MAETVITWKTPLTNAIINGDGDLEKNAGADNCFTNASGSGDAGARSNEEISSGNWEFQCTLGPLAGASGRSFVGIDHGGTYTADFSQWDYCIHVSTESNTSGTPHPINSIFIYEGGAPNKTYLDGVWEEGKLLRIVCINNVVRYYLDSLLIYTSATAPTYSLYAVVSLACLNKTVLDPKFITSAGTGACEEGPTVLGGCQGSWTIPTPAALPLTGIDFTYFQEIEGDWGEIEQEFPDGTPNATTIQTSAVRRFEVEWDGLSETDAQDMDAHYDSTSGGLKFTVTHPHTGETITGIRYEDYNRADHQKVWAQKRTARLVKYTS